MNVLVSARRVQKNAGHIVVCVRLGNRTMVESGRNALLRGKVCLFDDGEKTMIEDLRRKWEDEKIDVLIPDGDGLKKIHSWKELKNE